MRFKPAFGEGGFRAGGRRGRGRGRGGRWAFIWLRDAER